MPMSTGPLSFTDKLDTIKGFFNSFLPRIAPQFQDCFYQLAKTVTVKTYEKDEAVIVEGDEADSMVFWSDGPWRVTINHDNNMHVIEEGNGSTIFGEQVIVTEHLKRKATVWANGPATAVFLFARDLKHMSTAYPILYSSLLALIILVYSVRLQRLSNKYVETCDRLGKFEGEEPFF